MSLFLNFSEEGHTFPESGEAQIGGAKKAELPPDVCLHKAGSPSVSCCGGKQLCYPNRDLRRMDFGQQESQQERL